VLSFAIRRYQERERERERARRAQSAGREAAGNGGREAEG
jgi:D-alanine-D-alanine ligase